MPRPSKPARPAVILLVAVMIAACATQSGERQLDASLLAAHSTLGRVEAGQHSQLYSEMERKAKARLIVSPGEGRAVAYARKPGTQGWTGPAFYEVTRVYAEGAGFAAQEQDLELVALIMSDKAMDWLMSPKLPGMAQLRIETIDAAGRGSMGSMDDSDAVVFDLSKKGSGKQGLSTVATVDAEANQAYYGRPVGPAEIFSGKVERAVK